MRNFIHHEFVELAARTLYRTEQEVIDELLSTNWFKFDKKSFM